MSFLVSGRPDIVVHEHPTGCFDDALVAKCNSCHTRFMFWHRDFAEYPKYLNEDATGEDVKSRLLRLISSEADLVAELSFNLTLPLQLQTRTRKDAR